MGFGVRSMVVVVVGVTVAVGFPEALAVALPADARRRWDLADGGTVEVADLGDALVIVPAGRGGLRGVLRSAIDDAGGYAYLAAEAGSTDPDLA